MKFRKNVLWSVCAIALAAQIFVANNVSAYYSCSSSMLAHADQNIASTNERVTKEIFSASQGGIAFGGEEMNMSLRLGGKYSSVENRALDGNPKGHLVEGSAFATMALGESLTLGLGYTHSRYDVSGAAFDVEGHSQAIDMVLAYNLGNGLSVAAFVNFSTVDVEDNAWWMQDTFDRWGMGLAVIYTHNINEKLNFSYMGLISSLNKSSVARLMDNEDSSFVNMVDLSYSINDAVSVSIYGISYTALDREDNRVDECYFEYGVDVDFAITSSMALSVGYETTAADEDNNTDTLNVAMQFNF